MGFVLFDLYQSFSTVLLIALQKEWFMKNILFLIVLVSNIILAQNKRLRFHSTSLGIGMFYINDAKPNSSLETFQNGGFSISTEITLNSDRNLFSISYLHGVEIALLGPSYFNNSEYNLMYGREVPATNWLNTEGYIGIGLYNQKDLIDKNEFNQTKIAVPIKINLILFPKGQFNIGFNGNYNFNSLNNTMSAHLLLRFNFKK